MQQHVIYALITLCRAHATTLPANAAARHMNAMPLQQSSPHATTRPANAAVCHANVMPLQQSSPHPRLLNAPTYLSKRLLIRVHPPILVQKLHSHVGCELLPSSLNYRPPLRKAADFANGILHLYRSRGRGWLCQLVVCWPPFRGPQWVPWYRAWKIYIEIIKIYYIYIVNCSVFNFLIFIFLLYYLLQTYNIAINNGWYFLHIFIKLKLKICNYII